MTVANEVQERPVVKTHAAPPPPPLSGGEERKRLRMMMLIRRFEETTYREYSSPRDVQDSFCKRCAENHNELKIGGFCHLYSGQEAIAVGISSMFRRGKDYL